MAGGFGSYRYPLGVDPWHRIVEVGWGLFIAVVDYECVDWNNYEIRAEKPREDYEIPILLGAEDDQPIPTFADGGWYGWDSAAEKEQHDPGPFLSLLHLCVVDSMLYDRGGKVDWVDTGFVTAIGPGVLFQTGIVTGPWGSVGDWIGAEAMSAMGYVPYETLQIPANRVADMYAILHARNPDAIYRLFVSTNGNILEFKYQIRTVTGPSYADVNRNVWMVSFKKAQTVSIRQDRFTEANRPVGTRNNLFRVRIYGPKTTFALKTPTGGTVGENYAKRDVVAVTGKLIREFSKSVPMTQLGEIARFNAAGFVT